MTQSADPLASLPKTVDKDDRVFNLEQFTKTAAGFAFYSVEFKTLAAAVEHYTKLNTSTEDTGESIAVAMINMAHNFALRNKAKNKLPADSSELQKKRDRGEFLLLSIEDSDAFLPGTREIRSMSGLQKSVNEHKKLALAAKEAGDANKYEFHKAESKRYFNLLIQKQAEMLAGVEDL